MNTSYLLADCHKWIKENNIFDKESRNTLMNTSFIFTMECAAGEKINMFHIHDFLLMRQSFPELKMELNIKKIYNSKELENKESIRDYFRIAAYIADLGEEEKQWIILNGKSVKEFDDEHIYERIGSIHSLKYTNTQYIGKLFPAIHLDSETLAFLQAPIDIEVWSILVPGDVFNEKTRINRKSFDKISSLHSAAIKKHWLLLEACQKFLFDEFPNNKSKPYTELRRKVFSTPLFYDQHIKNMPLISVILFAQYDYFYRSYILSAYKEFSKTHQFYKTDFIKEAQENQKYDRYVAYKKMLRNGDDIKSIIKLSDNTGSMSEKDIDDTIESGFFTPHESIIAELFDAMTIGEGLLQLIENAVLHTGGGLLSFRIRNKKDEGDKTYLSREYPEFFISNESETGQNRVNFFLEIKISDLFEKDLTTVFFENVNKRSKDLNQPLELREKLSNWYTNYKNAFSECGIFKPFFKPNNKQQEAWKEYYGISDNQVHHYGLQILESIVLAKGGVLFISGHGAVYHDQKSISIPNNGKHIPGTAYRLLLPLSKSNLSYKNIITDTCFEKYTPQVSVVTFPQKLEVPVIRPNQSKEQYIKGIAEEFSKQFKGSKSGQCFVVNYKSIIHQNPRIEEMLIKGLLLSLLQKDDIVPPVAIINLSSHALLETSRLIALFYDKAGKSTGKMKGIQIFLQGTEVGEEILFAGDNLNRNADRLRRIAMTRGIMFDYWQIANILMKRLQ